LLIEETQIPMQIKKESTHLGEIVIV